MTNSHQSCNWTVLFNGIGFETVCFITRRDTVHNKNDAPVSFFLLFVSLIRSSFYHVSTLSFLPSYNVFYKRKINSIYLFSFKHHLNLLKQ